MRFVDTNIFIRYITRDDEKKAKKCYLLFKKAKENKLQLTTSESVLSEVVYTLFSKKLYKLTRSRIRDVLYPMVKLAGLKISFKKQFLQALEIFANSNLDFEDALTMALMRKRKIREIYSYDKDFDKFNQITRIEP